MIILWRASQLLQICLVDKLVIPLYIPLYPVTLICIHICVQKYTSVYLLLSTDFIAYVFRVLLKYDKKLTYDKVDGSGPRKPQ